MSSRKHLNIFYCINFRIFNSYELHREIRLHVLMSQGGLSSVKILCYFRGGGLYLLAPPLVNTFENDYSITFIVFELIRYLFIYLYVNILLYVFLFQSQNLNDSGGYLNDELAPYPTHPPPPSPPLISKVEIYSDPSVFLELDQVAINVSMFSQRF